MKTSHTAKTLIRFASLLVCCVTLSACALPGSQKLLKQAIVQTAVVDSLVGTHAAGTLTAIIPTLTTTPLPPTITPTPTNTPLPDITPTLAGVWLTLPEDTDCRAGAGWGYQTITRFNAGQVIEIMALDPFNEFFYVRDPNNFSQYCWISVPSTQVTGNLSRLPVITVAPSIPVAATQTGTPAALDFYVRFERVINCKENYGIVLYVENTGSIILRSIRVILTDTSANRSYLHDSNIFRGTTVDECELDLANAYGDLMYGEGSLVACVNAGQFNYNPAGHSFTVKITLYNQDDRKGESVTKTINFIP